jgi:tetratricopeptide (TPR) repeat protein
MGGLSRASTQASVDYLNQAIAADSTFAPAYAALAWAYLRSPGWISTRTEDQRAARRAADRALALGPELGYSHAVKAWIAFGADWDWAAAEREFKTAIELTPSLPEAHHFYSHFLLAEGRVRESLEQSETFLSLDPMAREAWVHRGWHHLFAGEYEPAMADLRKALTIDPGNAQALVLSSYALERLRRYPEALAAARRAADLDPAQDTLFIAALCAAMSGDRGLAERQARSLSVETLAGRGFEYDAARVFAALGRRDDAFHLLDDAVNERSERLALLIQDPWLATLRSDSRFAALIRRMGLRV